MFKLCLSTVITSESICHFWFYRPFHFLCRMVYLMNDLNLIFAVEIIPIILVANIFSDASRIFSNLFILKNIVTSSNKSHKNSLLNLYKIVKNRRVLSWSLLLTFINSVYTTSLFLCYLKRLNIFCLASLLCA